MSRMTMRLHCAAKINLSLDVTGKRPDGYHTLESIFQSVAVYDTIDLSAEEGAGITLRCDTEGVPCDETNLAWKAAKALLDASGKQTAVTITLTKCIPSGAGMGGGSADAAGVLYGLNQLLDCGFSQAELCSIGLKLGADVPFMLLGGTAYIEGIGEKMTPLAPLPALPLVIVKGAESISTPAAYRAIDTLKTPPHPDTAAMLYAVETQDTALLCRSCGNLFEAVTDCADVRRAKAALLAEGAACAVMTGSGSAVFGLFTEAERAADCAVHLKEQFSFVQACTLTDMPFIVE